MRLTCIIVGMASYNPRNNNILKDTLLVGIINSATSIFSGFVIFSVLGYVAHIQQKEVKEVSMQRSLSTKSFVAESETHV